MIKTTSPLAFLLVFILTSCSSGSDAVYQTRFDFSKAKTYSIYKRNSTFTETQNLTDSKRNSIEIAIEIAIEGLGLNYQEVDKADIVVTYHLLNGEKNDYHDYNKAVLFCPHCLKANNWHKGKDNLKIKTGSLIIDLIDPQKKRSIWRNIAPLNLKEKDDSRVFNEKIQEEISIMLQQYPTVK